MADHDLEFAAYDDDPWLTVSRALNVVSLDQHGGDVEDPNPPKEGAREEAERDLSGTIEALTRATRLLTHDERFVVFSRMIGASYREIASAANLSGPGQVQKIERRALTKLQKRLAKLPNPFKDPRP
jgi:DNA-directed RNA polymerase specialized sigma24 family protein